MQLNRLELAGSSVYVIESWKRENSGGDSEDYFDFMAFNRQEFAVLDSRKAD
jgi:hypothetical protein